MAKPLLKHNKYLIYGSLLIVLVFAVILFFTLTKSSVNSQDTNPFIKEMPAMYSSLLQKATEKKKNYFIIINNNNVVDELLIFKKFLITNEKEVDFSLQLFYTDSLQKEKKLSFKIINKAVQYNKDGVVYGIFKQQLPKVTINKIKILKHKYQNRPDKTKWETVLENIKTNKTEPLKFDKKKYSDFSSPNTYIHFFLQLLDSVKIKHLSYKYTLKNNTLVQTHKTVASYVKDNKTTIAVVNNSVKFWDYFNAKNDSIFSKISIKGADKEAIHAKLKQYINNKIPINNVFDIDKLSNYFTLINIFSNGCDYKTHFIFNSSTNLIEPFYTNSNCLGERAKIVYRPKLTNRYFTENYTKTVENITKQPLTEIKNKKKFKQELALINTYYPDQLYDYNNLLVNKNLLERSIFPSLYLRTELISISKENLKISIRNLSNFPVTIKGLNYKSNKRITTLSPPQIIDPLQVIETDIPLPRSFENLFVHKKTKTTGFKLSKDSYDLRVVFSVYGLDSIQKAKIIPYQAYEKTLLGEDLFRKKINIDAVKEVVVNHASKEITLLKSVTINSPLIIPSGYIFKAKAGTKINIIEGGKIISNSPLAFIGTEENPITIFSSDKKGQGMIVFANGEKSNLEYVYFNDLTNPAHGSWSVTGAVTFYESPVNLAFVKVSNNRCEDALNIIRTTFLMNNCEISNTQSDAFDGDFVEGTIKNSTFINLGNDGIDISGSTIFIDNVEIKKAGDKALSAGENSSMNINKVTIIACEIGAASKDLSIIEGQDIRIKNTKLAFTAFKKKPEFGPSHIKLLKVKLTNVETEYLIENKSSLIFNGKTAQTLKDVKSKMYGVEFGKSSKETRNSQN